MHHELIHESRVNIHALQLIFMHREKISYLAEIYALQEDFIPCRIYELREDIHAPQNITHPESIFMYRRRSCIESQYSCIVEDHASLVNIHALVKIMHHELIFMHRELIFMHCELIFMHRKLICMHHEKISNLAKIYPSQEDFIPCGIYALREDIHASQKIMYRDSIFMHRGNHALRVNIHASRKIMHTC